MTPCPSPRCGFKTSPYVRSKRPRVYRQHAHMFQHICACCPHTRRRFECTHGGVFEWTHGFFHVFSACRNTHKHTPRPPTTPRPQRHTTQHNTTQHNTTHGDRDRDRQKQRETEKERQRKRDRERETEKEKRRQVSGCCVLCVVVVLVVVVVVEEGERRRGETNRTIWAKVSLKIT